MECLTICGPLVGVFHPYFNGVIGPYLWPPFFPQFNFSEKRVPPLAATFYGQSPLKHVHRSGKAVGACVLPETTIHTVDGSEIPNHHLE